MQDSASLYDDEGKRLYLTPEERAVFMREAKGLAPHERTFCAMLHDTGARVSEALNLTYGRIDLPARRVVLETLKKRRRGVFRGVPVPDEALDLLDVVHGVRASGKGKNAPSPDAPLWTFSRPTAWRIVKGVMQRAGIEDGPHQSPKGLRHGFGINAILSGVPVTTLQKWMGHSKLETTAHYLDAIGPQEREIAARMWVGGV